MDDHATDAFANRDEPVPVLTVTYDDVDASSSEVEYSSKRDRLRKSLSGTRLGEKVHEFHSDRIQASATERLSLQDRLFTKLLSQVIPTEDIEFKDEGKVDPRSSQYVKRPAFSLPVMTNNFRRFNARIGIVFVFQNKLIRLFGWRTTTHTLSFLAVYTFVCLDPYLFVALPLAFALLFIMVPAFVSRHPPPPTPAVSPSTSSKHDSAAAYSYSGPALAPPRTIKPAAETSKDFFRNMRDLQNSMADFSNIHDTLVSTIAPATNFSDETLSSTIFLYLTILTTALFVAAQLIPFRLVLLIGGYALTISGHPKVQIWLLKQQKKAERNLSYEKAQVSICGLRFPANRTTLKLKNFLSAMSEITLNSTAETREVEVFEIQHRPLLPAYQSTSVAVSATTSLFEWQPHLFSPNPYDPLSPSRIAGDRPRGSRFFEDVQPPNGWEWASKKWELDLEAGEWVDERLIVGVEYDKIHTYGDDDDDDDNDENDDMNNGSNNSLNLNLGGETAVKENEISSFSESRKRQQSVNLDFGGWVWDLPPAIGTSGNRDEEVWLAYGDYDIPSLLDEKERKKDERSEKKGHKKTAGSKTGSLGVVGKDWEESVRYGNKGRTGEWRRRRWVRVVKRISMSGNGQ